MPIPDGKKYINWAYVKHYPLSYYSAKGNKAQRCKSAKLQGMYYQGDDRIFDRNELDVRLLKYNYAIIDLRDGC